MHPLQPIGSRGISAGFDYLATWTLWTRAPGTTVADAILAIRLDADSHEKLRRSNLWKVKDSKHLQSVESQCEVRMRL